MKNPMRIYHGTLPPELVELLEQTRPLAEVQAELARERVNLDDDPEFVASRLKADVVEELLRAMEKRGMRQVQLAEKLGKTKQWVSRILNESDNFTVSTVARLAWAMGMHPFINFADRDEMVQVTPFHLESATVEAICPKGWRSSINKGTVRIVSPQHQNEEDALVA